MWTAPRPGKRHSDPHASAPDRANSSVFSRPSDVPSGRCWPRRRPDSWRPRQSTPSSIGDPRRSLGFERRPCVARRRRANHARAVAVACDIASKQRPSFITNYIEAETHAFLSPLQRSDDARVPFHVYEIPEIAPKNFEMSGTKKTRAVDIIASCCGIALRMSRALSRFSRRHHSHDPHTALPLLHSRE